MENWEIVGGGGEGVHIATSVLKGQWLEISHIGDVTKGKVDSCLTCRLKEMENVSNFMCTEIWKM